jgi:Holliday junction DNA helicase RuvA
MIAFLRGQLLSKKPANITIDVSGVGYMVLVPLNTLSHLPDEGKDISLHIYTHVREDTLQLYGFSSEDEKRIFITLIGVTGIGPKMALNILSGISHDDLIRAIETEDVAYLCRIPGLGKKTAHRLILELREKLPTTSEPIDRTFEDTLSALVNLGYKKTVARQSLEKAYRKEFHDIEGLLKEALKYLTGETNEKTG